MESVPSEYNCFLNQAVFKFDIISTILSGIVYKQTCMHVLWLQSLTERERETDRQTDRQTEREEKTDMTRTFFSLSACQRLKYLKIFRT